MSPIAPATAFTYDPFNRLSGVTGSGINASYKIAATGMRVEKASGNQTTRFVYGLSGQLLYERNTTTNLRSQYLYLDGQPVGLVRNGTLYYVLPDHLGRPEVIVNQNRDQVWRANLTAFERRVVRDQIGGYALGFPGQYHDPETGFAYNVHRDYDPATGRYIQSDPIGLAGGLNTYAYAYNSPIQVVDPLGRQGFFIPSPDRPMPYASYLGADPSAATYGMNMCVGACSSLNSYIGGGLQVSIHLMAGTGFGRLAQNISVSAIQKACAAGVIGAAICTGNFHKLRQFERQRDALNQVRRDAEYAGQCRVGDQVQFSIGPGP